MDPKTKLMDAISFVINTNELRLYGVSIYSLRIDYKTIPQQVNEKFHGIFTANVGILNDGRIRLTIYEEFIEQHTIKEIVFILLHEICHVLFDHLSSIRKTDIHTILNMAMDHVINVPLMNDVNDRKLQKVEVPKGICIIPPLVDKQMSHREIYNWLLENSTTTKIPMKGSGSDSGSGSESNQNDDSGDDDSEVYIEKTVIEPNGKGKTKEQDKITIYSVPDIQPGLTSEQKQTARDASERMKSEMRAAEQEIRNRFRGTETGQFYELIKKTLEVKIPWTELLKKAILTKSKINYETRAFPHINRIYKSSLGITLPGYDTDDVVNQLIICRDTSGSISHKELQKWAKITLDSATHFTSIRIIDHDVVIQPESNVVIPSDEISITDLTRKFHGRGGTSHEDVFDLLEKLYIESEEEISLVMFLTDFESDIEGIWDKYQWHKFLPLSIICPNNHIQIPKHIDDKPVFIKD